MVAAIIQSMNRKQLHGALLIAAASLLATGAYAEPPTTPPGKATAADKPADKAGDKAADAKDKIKDKADKAADKAKDAVEPAKTADDRAARKAKEHDAQRDKLRGMLKAPMSDALKQELRRHAERVARLERIKSVAQTEKDNDTVEKATKLLAKENDRHDKWVTKHVSAPGVPTTVTNPKEGAK